jgi:5-deoxy-glucuronate isomerase
MSELFRPAGSLKGRADPLELPPDGEALEFCGLNVLELAPDEHRSIQLDGIEAALLPLSGSCRVEIGSDTYELEGRADVFSRVTDLVYAPVGTELLVSSPTGGQFAFPYARAEKRYEVAYVSASQVPVEVRGGGHATRQINNFLSADNFEADRLIAVEVLTPGGNWSSFPPHKHDEDTERETPLEEIYYFRIGGTDGFGIHRTYTLDGTIDETVTVRDGDVFLVPRGFHGPCVAPPGYPMYYLNVMAGPMEREWKITTDPAHEWLVGFMEELGPDPRCPMTTAAGPRVAETLERS